MPLPSRCRRWLLRALPGLLALSAACSDAPLGPHALQQLAGGERWVAVAVPDRLPTLGDWLPSLDRSTAAGREVATRAESLRGEAQAARAAGRLEEAARLEREALRLVIGSLDRAPDARLMRDAFHAIDAWCDRVRSEVVLDEVPRVAVSLRAVEAARTSAAASLTAGDTAGAVLRIAFAAEQIREHAPPAVALRVLEQVETRLRQLPEGEPGRRRALRLLRSAREELARGSSSRALQRALYALQLAEGRQVPTDTARVSESCRGPACAP
jgi:hypothetical protein